MTNRPDTIVLVHGLWMTPRSWEGWVARYEAQGFAVLTPGYPGFEIEVEALRENPDVIANLTVPETVYHLASAIESTDQALPFGVASCTLAAEDVEVVNAIHGSPPTTAIDGPNPGVSVTWDTVAWVVVAGSSEPVA